MCTHTRSLRSMTAHLPTLSSPNHLHKHHRLSGLPYRTCAALMMDGHLPPRRVTSSILIASLDASANCRRGRSTRHVPTPKAGGLFNRNEHDFLAQRTRFAFVLSDFFLQGVISVTFLSQKTKMVIKQQNGTRSPIIRIVTRSWE